MKELINEIFEKLKSFSEELQEVKASIPTIPEPELYDDSELKASIEEVKASIPEVPEPELYDDSELKASIEEVKASIPDVPEPTPAYDDSELKASIEEVKEYYEDKLQESIDAVQGVFKEEIKALKETPVTVDLTDAKEYDGKEVKKGSIVLYKNAMYINLLEGNSSEPVEGNASYKCLVRPPKDIEFKGLYSGEKAYTLNNLVHHKNATWINTGKEGIPGESDAWKLVAKAVKGEKGAKVIVKENDKELLQSMAEEIENLRDEITFLKGVK